MEGEQREVVLEIFQLLLQKQLFNPVGNSINYFNRSVIKGFKKCKTAKRENRILKSLKIQPVPFRKKTCFPDSGIRKFRHLP